MSEWISVKKKLPNFDEYVLWVNDECNYSVECLDKDMVVWSFILDYKITHWQPLPEPPNDL